MWYVGHSFQWKVSCVKHSSKKSLRKWQLSEGVLHFRFCFFSEYLLETYSCVKWKNKNKNKKYINQSC